MASKKKKKNVVKPFLEPEVAVNLILRETDSHSDRGLVLLCGAVLDRALEKLIRMKFTDISQATEDELDFLLIKQPVPPLGELPSPIKGPTPKPLPVHPA